MLFAGFAISEEDSILSQLLTLNSQLSAGGKRRGQIHADEYLGRRAGAGPGPDHAGRQGSHLPFPRPIPERGHRVHPSGAEPDQRLAGV